MALLEHYDSKKIVRQLWSTRMNDMQQKTDSQDNVAYCVCCARPIVTTDVGTRKMTFCSNFVDMLNHCKVDKDSLLYNEQCKIIRHGRECNFVFVCYICLPSWKKSIQQNETGKKVELPSLFMHKSHEFLLNSAESTDKLSLLKFLLCATSEVCISGPKGSKIRYHPLRNSDNVLLEASIVFLRFLFRQHDYNVRAFSKTFCHFQIVSIARWHVSGFPLIMNQNRHTQDLRKALRGNVGVLYRSLWGFATSFVDIHNVTGLLQENNTECAACVHHMSHAKQMLSVTPQIPHTRDILAAPPKKKRKASYDSFFLHKWSHINKYIEHKTLAQCGHNDISIVNAQRIFCKLHLSNSVVSYIFYRSISVKFPRSFRQRNIRRYYNRVLFSQNKQ